MSEKIYELFNIIRNKMDKKYKNCCSCPHVKDRYEFEPELSNLIPELKNCKDIFWDEHKSARSYKDRKTIDCFINKLKKTFPEFNKSSKNALNNEKTFIDEFNNNNEYKKYIIESIGYKESNYNDYIAIKPSLKNTPMTTLWKNHKNGTNEKIPKLKTDVIIKNIKTNIEFGISIKSGAGRFTSGDKYETNALFMSVLESKKYENHESLEKKVKELFEIVSEKRKVIEDKNITFNNLKKMLVTDPTNKDVEWCSMKLIEYEKCNKIWKELIDNYKEFCIDIIKETLQGKLKFDNIGKADILINLNECTTEVVSIINFNESKINQSSVKYVSNKIINFDDYVKSQFETSTIKGNVFATKSSSTRTGRVFWTRFL